MRFLARLFAASILAVTAPALADGGTDTPAAQALFDEGQRLVAAGKYADACPKFEASQALDPTIGTLLNLADCLEKNGQYASAWPRYLEVARLAEKAHQDERARYATFRARLMESRMSRLTIDVPDRQKDVSVRRNGVPVDAAVFGVAVPVDSGDYVLEASAPGKVSWSKTVHVEKTAHHVRIEVPTLESMPQAETRPVAPPQPIIATKPSVAPQAATEVPRRGPSPLVYIGFGVMGLGAAIGTLTGILAFDRADRVKPRCDGNECPRTVHDDLVAGLTYGDISNVAFVVAGVGAALGVAGLFVFAPKKSTGSAGWRIGFTGTSVAASGAW